MFDGALERRLLLHCVFLNVVCAIRCVFVVYIGMIGVHVDNCFACFLFVVAVCFVQLESVASYHLNYSMFAEFCIFCSWLCLTYVR